MPLTIFLVGLGAVGTTLMAGVELVRRGLAAPVGALSQQPGRGRSLATLEELRFVSWDIRTGNAREAAEGAGVLSPAHLAEVSPLLATHRPHAGIFFPTNAPQIHGDHVKVGSLLEQVSELRREIRSSLGPGSRGVMLYAASTERPQALAGCHETAAAFERGLQEGDPQISAPQVYAWAALREGIPFANLTPNAALDFPAGRELARSRRVPFCGDDLKSGQTWLKTALAPALRDRQLGVNGWYSSNILGNRDGLALSDAATAEAKTRTKEGVLDGLLDGSDRPDLYGELSHKVRIDFLPSRGDTKESWDHVDLFGFLGYPMELRFHFAARDSILAAPLALDVALFLDLARRQECLGPQTWLSFYFKRPLTELGERAVHDVFLQRAQLDQALARLRTS